MKTYIHLSPALQEFVYCSLLNNTNVVTSASLFGKIIKPWLTKPPQGYNPMIPTDDKNIFIFELPLYADKNTLYNFYISPAGEKYIAGVLKTIFLTQLYIFLDKMLAKNFEIKQAIYDFCYSYNITMEHVNYDSLKKSYYRHRIKKKT